MVNLGILPLFFLAGCAGAGKEAVLPPPEKTEPPALVERLGWATRTSEPQDFVLQSRGTEPAGFPNVGVTPKGRDEQALQGKDLAAAEKNLNSRLSRDKKR